MTTATPTSTFERLGTTSLMVLYYLLWVSAMLGISGIVWVVLSSLTEGVVS